MKADEQHQNQNQVRTPVRRKKQRQDTALQQGKKDPDQQIE